MERAQRLLATAIDAHKHRLKGYEQPSEVLTFATVRALDNIYCRELFATDEPESLADKRAYEIMSWGSNQAMRRILPDSFQSGPFKLFACNKSRSEKVNDFVLECGFLEKAERLSEWLREGLISASVRKLPPLPTAPETEYILILKTADPSLYGEVIGRRGVRWTSDLIMKNDRPRELELERQHMEILPELVQRVDVLSDWGIQYSTTKAIDSYFLQWGQLYLRRMYGQDMIGLEETIGGQTFNTYLGVLAALAGRAQKHLCYAAILKRRYPHLLLQNLLTTFCPVDEFIRGLAAFLDADTFLIQKLLSHLTLDPSNKKLHTQISETAWAPLVRASNDHFILPLYGLEINPFLFLLNDLRGKYPTDWFSAANNRENRWLADLRALFEGARWLATGRSIKLRDGNRDVTDIDFAAYDAATKELALFQLKWQQPVGMDNRARRSAGSNLC